MKKQIYFFGLSKKKHATCLLDPVVIDENNELNNFEYLGNYAYKDNSLFDRGCFFVHFNKEKEIREFLKEFNLSNPSEHRAHELSIYFLDDRKLVLFKINMNYEEEVAYNKVYEIVKKLKLFKKEEIIQKGTDYYEDFVFVNENKKAKISIWIPYYCFFTLETGNYEGLKQKINKVYPKKR
jgi:hypothetical protein